MKYLFLLAFSLFFVQTGFAQKKKAYDVRAALLQDFPIVYYDYFGNLNRKEFASYQGIVKKDKMHYAVEITTLQNEEKYATKFYKDERLETKIGLWKNYNKQGKVIKESTYNEKGECEGIVLYDSLGKINGRDIYIKGKNTETLVYFPNGKTKYSTIYLESRIQQTTCFRADDSKAYTRTSGTTTSIECFDRKNKTCACDSINTKIDAILGSSDAFAFVEKRPEFPGGDAALMSFLATYIHYPDEAREQDIEGKVFLSFIVNKEGEIEHVVPIRYPHHILMQEAVKVVKTMPKWVPGTHYGVPVKVQFTLPVQFKLD